MTQINEVTTLEKNQIIKLIALDQTREPEEGIYRIGDLSGGEAEIYKGREFYGWLSQAEIDEKLLSIGLLEIKEYPEYYL